MGFTTTTVWEVNPTGSDTLNGGGFDPGNPNMATDLVATLATSTAPVVTSASYNFVARDVGHWLFVKLGTNWVPGWYQIASVAANAATLTATVGSARLYIYGQATSLSTVVGCASTAGPTGGTWSIDYSQSVAAAVTFTDLVIDGTTNTVFTSAGNPIGKNFVGNVFAVTSGTGFTVQRVQVVSVAGAAGTGDKSLGTLASTGGNGGLGGGLASPGKSSGLATGGIVFVRPSTYAFTNAANVAGGEVSAQDGVIMVGYNTTRTINNSDTTRPVFQATTNNRTLCINSSGMFRNLEAVANGKTGCIAFQTNGYSSKFNNCSATGGFATGFNTNWSGDLFMDCYSSGSSNGFTLGGGNGNQAYGCVAVSGGVGFNLGFGSSVSFCIAANNTSYGFTAGSGASGVAITNCSAYNNATGGIATANFSIGANATGIIRNCLAYGSILNNFETAATATNQIINCAGGGATNLNVNPATGSGISIICGFITLTTNPFTDVAGGDYSLNTAAGGGALCRGAGAPGVFVGLTTTKSYLDIGAVQHADPVLTAGPVYFAW